MKTFMNALVLALVPVVLVIQVGTISLCMYFITPYKFSDISTHPVTWIVAVVATLAAFIYYSSEKEE